MRKTVKQQVTGRIQELKTSYIEQLKIIKPHMYTIAHQYDVMRAKKNELAVNEGMLHIDFSENWTVKTLSAVQSAHFGASVEQITLHTGVAYFTANQSMSFCSISDNRDHGPAAVWSHILPILEHIKKYRDNIDTLHFASDGPTTQYRNRFNFFLATHFPAKIGFRIAWWNFSEAGHGKGPADGVGAAIKRLADGLVLAG